MLHKDERGVSVLPLVIVTVLLLGALGFGFWAYAGMQDYKNNVDEKIAEAVDVAVEQNSIEKDAEYAEESKNPYNTYSGPSAYGSLKIKYPKTWSAYVDENAKSNTVIQGYFHPNFVPSINQDTINYALRVEVVDIIYDEVADDFDSASADGRVQSVPYRAKNVPDALGSKITGELTSKKRGVLVLLPLRDKTLKIWTEGEDFTADFEKILQNLTFVP